MVSCMDAFFLGGGHREKKILNYENRERARTGTDPRAYILVVYTFV